MTEISNFLRWLKDDSDSWPRHSELVQLQNAGVSTAGRHSLEELFSREVLVPAFRRYFYEPNFMARHSFGAEDVKRGLGVEGFKNCEGFGFTPARKKTHILTKSDIVSPTPPNWWFEPDAKVLGNRPCPDFAMRAPLPFNAVGEVKYFTGKTEESARTMIYNAIRQAIFYLGAYAGEYSTAIVIIADGSEGGIARDVFGGAHPALLERLGEESRVCVQILQSGASFSSDC